MNDPLKAIPVPSTTVGTCIVCTREIAVRELNDQSRRKLGRVRDAAVETRTCSCTTATAQGTATSSTACGQPAATSCRRSLTSTARSREDEGQGRRLPRPTPGRPGGRAAQAGKAARATTPSLILLGRSVVQGAGPAARVAVPTIAPAWHRALQGVAVAAPSRWRIRAPDRVVHPGSRPHGESGQGVEGRPLRREEPVPDPTRRRRRRFFRGGRG